MELKWLEDYLTLAKHNNFSEAAKARHMTQPAFSRRVRLLESWLGVKLINRDTQPIQLTVAGNEFLPIAQGQVESIYRQRENLQRFAQGINTITIHTQHSLMVSHVPELLEHSSDSLFIRFTANNQQDAVQLFLIKESDFLLCFSALGMPHRLHANHLEGVCIGKDKLLAVTSANQYQTMVKNINAQQPIRMLSYPRESFFQRLVDKNWTATPNNNLNLQIVFENVLATSLKLMVQKGYGFAWLPESLIAQELNSGSLMLMPSDIFKPLGLEVSLYRHKNNIIKSNNDFWKTFTK